MKREWRADDKPEKLECRLSPEGALTKSFRELNPQKVLELKQCGLSNGQIAQRLGIAQDVIYHMLRRFDLSSLATSSNSSISYLDIKYALAKKGYSLTRLANELGLYGPQSIQQVLIRKYRSAKVEKRVSEITGLPLETLFPDRYQSAQHARKIRPGKSRGNDRI